MDKFYKHTIINNKSYYGKHVIIDGKKCNENIKNLNGVKTFIENLVQKINMIPHGDVIIDRFGEGNDIGISACQLITTSSITIHTNDKAKDFYLDVFSCKDFDEDIIIKMIKSRYNPEIINLTILFRK